MTRPLRARLARTVRRRRTVTVLAVGVAALCATTGSVLASTGAFSGDDNVWPYASPGRAPVLATVGDIACQPGSPVEAEKQSDVCDLTGTADTTRMAAQTATADQIEAMKPSLVALLGDEQYQTGRLQDFLGSFDQTYGAFKFLQRPTPGNHEFYTSHGESGNDGYGYFDYYNGYQLNADGTPVLHTFQGTTGPFTQPQPREDGQAGDFGTAGDGWYSYDLGSWHLISLNAECDVEPGGCNPDGSWLASQTAWLRHDLAEDRAPCTLAYWHQPTFGSTADPRSSDSEEGKAAATWWKLLYAHGTDVILNGHDHVYSRFAPMDPAGNADPQHGIREFIVGTGGESLDAVLPDTPNLQAWSDQYYGVMKMTLAPGGYSWDYQSALVSPTAPAGTPASYSDQGSARCHGPAGLTG